MSKPKNRIVAVSVPGGYVQPVLASVPIPHVPQSTGRKQHPARRLASSTPTALAGPVDSLPTSTSVAVPAATAAPPTVTPTAADPYATAAAPTGGYDTGIGDSRDAPGTASSSSGSAASSGSGSWWPVALAAAAIGGVFWLSNR